MPTNPLLTHIAAPAPAPAHNSNQLAVSSGPRVLTTTAHDPAVADCGSPASTPASPTGPKTRAVSPANISFRSAEQASPSGGRAPGAEQRTWDAKDRTRTMRFAFSPTRVPGGTPGESTMTAFARRIDRAIGGSCT